MEHKIVLNDKTLTYELVRKNVKNINLRIYPDGRVRVSASPWVQLKYIDEFVIKTLAKHDYNMDQKAENTEIRHFTKEDVEKCEEKILLAMGEFYPKFQQYKIPAPRISLRAMKTRWGSCTPGKGTIRFNLWLVDKPQECVDYVVVHELAHLVYPNHSKNFWKLVESILPDWKERKKRLNEKSL